MAAYMAGGAIVGTVSAYVGGAVATSGIPCANTLSTVSSSLVNSVGTYMYTGGKTDISISFGTVSYNFSKNEWGYPGKKGNSVIENIGYILGALANIGDLHGIYSDYKAAQHAAQKGTPIAGAGNVNMKEPWKTLGTKDGYNYYGPSKTGWDPEQIRNIKGGIEPMNALDELAFLHDVAHYNNGTEGLVASLFSTNRATIAADFALARGSVNLRRTGVVTGNVARTALTTAIGMYFLAGMHTLTVYSYYWPMLHNY
jgi:hypothetical protein